jgi:hypothetical protein
MTNYTGQRAQFVQTGDPTTVNEVTPYALGDLGKEVTVTNTSSSVDPGNAAKVFKYVRVDSAATVAPYIGAVAFWSNRDTFLVTTTATNRGQVAGIFCGPNPNVGNYGYIQVGGPAIVKFIDTPTAEPAATGAFVIASSTNAKADCLAAGTAATYRPIGQANGARNLITSEGEVLLTLGFTSNP